MTGESENKQGAFVFEINEDEKVCFVIAKGKITFQDSINAMKNLTKTPGYQPDFNVVVDVRLMHYHPAFNEYLELKRTLISLKNEYRNKIAFLSTELLWVLSELIAKYTQLNGMRVRAFTDAEKAIHWIHETP